MTRKLAAEFIGTFWLVAAVLGSALMAAGIPEVGIGWIGVSLAAGIAVLGMAYAVGGISGGHFNPAVTLGLALAGRTGWGDLIPYWIAQLLGGLAAMLVVWLVASGADGFAGVGAFAANGYGADGSPGDYSLLAGLVIEIALTAIFVIVILGSTSSAAPAGFAPLTIGLTLAVAHFVAIPVTNASLNPARSIASAVGAMLSGNMTPVAQVWLFILAPLAGGAVGAYIWKYLLSPGESPAGVGRKG